MAFLLDVRCLLPFGTVNCVQTRMANNRSDCNPNPDPNPNHGFCPNPEGRGNRTTTITLTLTLTLTLRPRQSKDKVKCVVIQRSGNECWLKCKLRWHGARFPTEIYTRGCHWIPRMFDPTLFHACDQWHSSRVSTPLTGSHCKSRPNTEGVSHQAH
jgi:hypothetical protein